MQTALTSDDIGRGSAFAAAMPMITSATGACQTLSGAAVE
jgi:hypothetical protein